MTLKETVVDAGEMLAALLAAGDRMHADQEAARQKVAGIIPRLVEDLLAGQFIEQHEKSAMARALADPAQALTVMANLIAEARDRASTKAATGGGEQRLGQLVSADPPVTGFVGSRSAGDRPSDLAFERTLFGTV